MAPDKVTERRWSQGFRFVSLDCYKMWVFFRQVFASDAEMTGVIITAYIFNVITAMTAVLAVAML